MPTKLEQPQDVLLVLSTLEQLKTTHGATSQLASRTQYSLETENAHSVPQAQYQTPPKDHAFKRLRPALNVLLKRQRMTNWDRHLNPIEGEWQLFKEKPLN